MPDAGARKAIYYAHTDFLSGSSRVFHFFDAAFVNASGVTITPDIFRQNAFVTLVDVIQNTLPNKMI